MFNLFKKKSGITMIALVVTIIILLILATIVTNIISNTNIFKRATNARNIYMDSQFNEISQVSSVSNEIDKIIKNNNDYSQEFIWLKDNQLLVNNENISSYTNIYNGITPGTMFLNYNINDSTIYNPRDLQIATSQIALTYLYAYNESKDSEYLEKAKLIAENLINNVEFTKDYAHSSEDPVTQLTCFPSQTKMNDGKWTYSSDLYSAPNGSLIFCKLLLDLTNVTGDSKYATEALKVIDSWIFIQGKIGNGALPNSIYYANLGWGEGMWPTLNQLPLDIAYSVYIAGNSAYNYTKDSKYKKFVDDYFNFVYNSFKNNSGMFTFSKNGTDYYLPYEYIYKTDDEKLIGVNNSNQDNSFSINNDITTDQLFYIELGLSLYDSNSDYAKNFMNTINELQFNDGQFWGEYTKNGEKGSFAETTVELVNSGFYIKLKKIFNQTNDIDKIKTMLLKLQKKSNDVNVNGAWNWSADENSFVIESLATAVLLEEIY